MKNIENNCKVVSRKNNTPKHCVYIERILGCDEDNMNKKKEFK